MFCSQFVSPIACTRDIANAVASRGAEFHDSGLFDLYRGASVNKRWLPAGRLPTFSCCYLSQSHHPTIERQLQDLVAKLVFESGNSRTRFPVAAKIALQSAGMNGGTPGSPTPAGGAALSTRWTLV